MPVPLLTYSIEDLPGLSGAHAQAVGSADRPMCALVSAYASYRRGNALRGQALGWSKDQIEAKVLAAAADLNVPQDLFEQWCDSLNGKRLAPPTIRTIETAEKTYELDPYQLGAIAHCSPAGGVFALDMGLGKTATSVGAAIEAFRQNYAEGRCWIICPLNAMGAWEPFIPVLKQYYPDVRILSIDSAHKYSAAAPEGGCLIFDEVHLLGAANARRTDHCHRLRYLFDFAVCNTGTLLHSGIEKVLSILDLAIPGAAHFASRWRCGEHFHCLVPQQIGSRRVVKIEKPADAHLEHLSTWIGNYTSILDTDSPTVQEAVSIPQQEDSQVPLALPWRTVEDEACEIIEAYLARGEELPNMAEVAHVMARSGTAAKIAWIQAHMDGSPLVIFAHYTETMDALEAWAKEHNYTYRRIDGSTKQEDRPAIEAAFQRGEFQILLGQMRAAGISLNLQRAWITIAVDFSWNPVDYAQAKRRTRRRGQTRTCFHFDLVAGRFQDTILKRIRAGLHFNARVAAYQSLRSVYAARAGGAPVVGDTR